jgi:hypothetical protein
VGRGCIQTSQPLAPPSHSPSPLVKTAHLCTLPPLQLLQYTPAPVLSDWRAPAGPVTPSSSVWVALPTNHHTTPHQHGMHALEDTPGGAHQQTHTEPTDPLDRSVRSVRQPLAQLLVQLPMQAGSQPCACPRNTSQLTYTHPHTPYQYTETLTQHTMRPPLPGARKRAPASSHHTLSERLACTHVCTMPWQPCHAALSQPC